MNLKTTFTAANVVLDVVARSTKKSGIAVFIRTKAGKAKATLGCRTIQADDAAAQAEYDRLVADVTAKGWVKGATKLGGAGRFTEVPAAPTANVIAEPAKLTGGAKAAADKKAAKAGK